ncbi:MAG: hypothetical protein O7D86_10290 [Proteobacteria bacterium]|nr:hypothetical protein [Pseudomonadota bacterium]
MKNTTQPVLKIVKLILLSASCVLGYTLWSELNSAVVLPVNTSINDKPVLTDNTSLQEIQYEVPQISSYDEIVNRPLFFEDRKPYVYVEPETPTREVRPKLMRITEQYSLNAVIITSDVKLAIIESGRKKSLTRITLGESIDGWTLENIEPRSILLKKGDETKNLELEVKTSKPQKKTSSNTKKQITNKTSRLKKNDTPAENDNNKTQIKAEKARLINDKALLLFNNNG